MSDMDEPYEPWAPVIGQRVRVRLSGECVMHEPEEDGATGTVTDRITQADLDIDNAKATDPRDVCSLADINYHVWNVEFDDPERVPFRMPFPVPVVVRAPALGYTRAWVDEEIYCAAELVPLDEA